MYRPALTTGHGKFYQQSLPQLKEHLQHQLLMDVSPLVDADNDRHGLLSQQGGQHDGSRDVSLPSKAGNGRQGALSRDGSQPNGSHDVSPSVNADNGRQGLSLNVLDTDDKGEP